MPLPDHAPASTLPAPTEPTEPITPLAGRERPQLLSVVMPAYNEARNLSWLLPRLVEELSPHAQALELLVIDDGSRDDTVMVVRGLIRQGLPVRLLRLSRNFGKEAALTAGLDAVEGDVVISMDSDGQHPISCAIKMLERWREGYDVVYGVQKGRRESQSLARRLYTRVFYWLMQKGSRFELPADAGDFRLLDRAVVLALRQLPERARYMKGLFAWVGFPATGIEFIPDARAHGETSFKFMGLLQLAVTGITAFSKVPLRVVSALGIVVSLLSVVFGFWIVFEKVFLGNEISGFATLAASITFLAGVQLLCLGIIAEYLGRVFDEVKRRPLYVTQDLTPSLRKPAVSDPEVRA
ncbi:glycosyltransferase family 2 protein [Pelomonas sp. APW6]|uniref:Glycosyltransferase family 2 protein n=1 Tax=Roseateles subflavus TaxID=3053353 RepID=A0ABT7LKP7_9BURK|nr:glycosyltransferase family 2 protein [Pelomonas sp. APW6]MDL5033439.1 glycosyltransferase family 2 protein [Pelomonas sp. APW6]